MARHRDDSTAGRSPIASWLRSTLPALAMAALAACASSPDVPSGGSTRLEHVRQWLVDDEGRVVMMRGGNVWALDEGVPETPRGQLWRDETPRLMAAQGFNGVRLVVHLSDIMPAPSRIDSAHLEVIADTVAAYREAGLYTLIDFHQDEYGPAVGVRGMPAWMTFSDGHLRNRDVHFPNGYFQEPAVQRAFDNFWANHPVAGVGRGVQDAYVDALASVARHFADEPAVFGVDVMNEPATGTPCSQPDPAAADCPHLEKALLAPFYERAGAALLAAAPDTLIFVEPFMLQGALGIPIRTPTPGIPRLNGLSYHNYGPLQAFRDRTNDNALAHAIDTDSALLNTEWGFTEDAAELAQQAQDFDDRLISWLAWARGPFEAVVNPELRRDDTDLDFVLRAFARPYPSLTSGTPTRLVFDANTGVLEYSYSTTGPRGRRFAGDARTEIRIPASNFPVGYRAEVRNARVVSAVDAPVLIVAADATAERVEVRVMRIGALPPLRPPSDELSTRSLLGDLLRDPRAREVLSRHAPGFEDPSRVGLSTQTTLRAMKSFDRSLTNEVLDRIDVELAALGRTAGTGPLRVHPSAQGILDAWPVPTRPLSVGNRIGDLLADPDARMIIERELPDVVTSEHLNYSLERTLVSIRALVPGLSDEKLAAIDAELRALPPR